MPVTVAAGWEQFRRLAEHPGYIGRRGRLPSPPAGPPPPAPSLLKPERMELLAADAAGSGLFTAVDVSAAAGSRVIDAGPGLLGGWTVRETTGSASAAAVLRDGAAEEATAVAEIAVASGASGSQVCPVPGIVVFSGLWLQVVSGAWEGSAWWLPLTVA